MKHVFIITGGYVDISFAKELIKTLSFDRVFAVDKGLEYAKELEIIPNLIIGDFDTVNKDILMEYQKIADLGEENLRIIKYPEDKDATDTELALYYAEKEGADKVTVIGATGKRIDHVLANIGLLNLAADKNITCEIVDANNRIRLISSENNNHDCILEIDKQWGDYISVIPVSQYVTGVTMTGVKYPLDNAVLKQGSSLTVSNEIIEKTARIHIDDGAVLIIESKD